MARAATGTAAGSKQSRQRVQLSCVLCRRYKRKCDRVSPCGECCFRGKQCSFPDKQATVKGPNVSSHTRDNRMTESLTPHPYPVLSSIISPSSETTSSTHHTSSSSYGQTSLDTRLTSSDGADFGIDASMPLEELVFMPGALEQIFSAWALEDDWYHEIIVGSPFSYAVMGKQPNIITIRRYAGVIFAIVAIVAQAHPSSIDALLLRFHFSTMKKGLLNVKGFDTAGDVGRAAEQAANAWLNEITGKTNATGWDADVFQTTFLLTKLCKFMGRWEEYKDCLARDMSRLQRAKLHHMSGVLREGRHSIEETCARYRVFWHYFTIERMSSILHGMPYSLQARNADICLFGQNGTIHVRTLCGEHNDSGAFADGSGSLPTYVVDALKISLSPCAHLMARLAADAGQIQDQIASLTAEPSISLQERYQRAEIIADKINVQTTRLDSRGNEAALSPAHSLLLSIATARVRRDAAILLSDSLHLRPDGLSQSELAAHIFYRRRLNMAQQLIEAAVMQAGRVPLHLLGEPYFTFFIHDPVIELTTAASTEFAANGDSSMVRDDLKAAIIGRNLLVIIAKQSELSLNHSLAKEACQLLREVLTRVLPDQPQIVQKVSDCTLIVNSSLLAPFEITAQSQGEHSPDTLQRAEDVLDWIASLPALQDIFSLYQSTQSIDTRLVT